VRVRVLRRLVSLVTISLSEELFPNVSDEHLAAAGGNGDDHPESPTSGAGRITAGKVNAGATVAPGESRVNA
jgi:hypothetical protein